MEKLAILILFTTIIWNTTATAQSNEAPSPSIGIGASVQATQSDINLPIWLNENTILSPSASFIYSEGNGTDLGVRFLMKF